MATYHDPRQVDSRSYDAEAPQYRDVDDVALSDDVETQAPVGGKVFSHTERHSMIRRVFQIRVSEEDYQRFCRAAEGKHLKLATWARTILLTHLSETSLAGKR